MLESAEFGQPVEVSLVRGEDADAEPSGADGDEGVVGEPALADGFVVMRGRQSRQHFAGLSPVALIWNQDSLGPIKVALKAFDGATVAVTGSGKEFFEDDRTQPQWRIGSQAPEG